MPGLSCVALSGMLRSCSSFCCASAVAALVESAPLELRVTDTDAAESQRMATAMKVTPASASRSENPRERRGRRSADRRLPEYIDGHRPGSGVRNRYRESHRRGEHAARVEDRSAGIRAESRRRRQLLQRGVGDEGVGRRLDLEDVAARRGERDAEAGVAGDGPLAGYLEVRDDLVGRAFERPRGRQCAEVRDRDAEYEAEQCG